MLALQATSMDVATPQGCSGRLPQPGEEHVEGCMKDEERSRQHQHRRRKKHGPLPSTSSPSSKPLCSSSALPSERAGPSTAQPLDATKSAARCKSRSLTGKLHDPYDETVRASYPLLRPLLGTMNRGDIPGFYFGDLALRCLFVKKTC